MNYSIKRLRDTDTVAQRQGWAQVDPSNESATVDNKSLSENVTSDDIWLSDCNAKIGHFLPVGYLLLPKLIQALKSFEEQLDDCKQKSCGDKKVMLLIQPKVMDLNF